MPSRCPFCTLPTEIVIDILKLIPTLDDLECVITSCTCLQSTLDFASHAILLPFLKESINDPILFRIATVIHATDASSCVENFDECRRIVLRGEKTPSPKRPMTIQDVKTTELVKRMAFIIAESPHPGLLKLITDRQHTRTILATFHLGFFLDTMWPFRNDTSTSEQDVYAIGAKWFSRSTPWAKEQVALAIDRLRDEHNNCRNFRDPGETLKRPTADPFTSILDDGADLKGNRWITSAHACLSEKYALDDPDHKLHLDSQAANGKFGWNLYSRAVATMPFHLQDRLFDAAHGGLTRTERMDGHLKALRESVSPAICTERMLWEGPSLPGQETPLSEMLREPPSDEERDPDMDAVFQQHLLSVREDKTELYNQLTSKQFDYDDGPEDEYHNPFHSSEPLGVLETSRCEISWRRRNESGCYPRWVASVLDAEWAPYRGLLGAGFVITGEF